MFNGRINRRNYILGLVLIVGTLIVLGLLFDLLLQENVFGDIIFSALILLTLPLVLSFYIRRLHDLGYTGWGALLLLIPLINCITLLIFLLVSGQDSDNRFGSKPLPKILSLKEMFGLNPPQQIVKEETKPIIPNNP